MCKRQRSWQKVGGLRWRERSIDRTRTISGIVLGSVLMCTVGWNHGNEAHGDLDMGTDWSDRLSSSRR